MIGIWTTVAARNLANLFRGGSDRELTDEEKARFQQQLSAILKYAERLNQINVSSIPPTETVLPLHSIMREDESSPSPARQSLLKNAPDTDKGCFRVPPVLE